MRTVSISYAASTNILRKLPVYVVHCSNTLPSVHINNCSYRCVEQGFTRNLCIYLLEGILSWLTCAKKPNKNAAERDNYLWETRVMQRLWPNSHNDNGSKDFERILLMTSSFNWLNLSQFNLQEKVMKRKMLGNNNTI